MKAEMSGSHTTQGSVRKQDSSFATVQKTKPGSRSPSVNYKNNELFNSLQNHVRIAQSVKATWKKTRLLRVKTSLAPELLLVDRSFIRCRKQKGGEGHFNTAKSP